MTRTLRHSLCAVVAACTIAGASFASAGDVTLKTAWLRPAAAGMPEALAYVDIVSETELELVGASTPFAKKVELVLVTMKDDVAATSIAASVMKKIRRPAPATHSFPTVADWASCLQKLRPCFGGGTGPFPVKLVEEAERLFSELIFSMGEPVVLHGDLHHFNILSSRREGWAAIDPQGVVGEAEYETGALLRNPSPDIYKHLHLEGVLARRMDQLAEELGFDRQRIRGWAIATALLSVWWYFEDTCESLSDEWRGAMEFAGIIARVR